VPKLVVPDNTKTGVTKACRYDPDLNPTYQEMAMHYGVGVVPARPYKPRDKAKVESGVQLAEAPPLTYIGFMHWNSFVGLATR
jgi:transposase